MLNTRLAFYGASLFYFSIPEILIKEIKILKNE